MSVYSKKPTRFLGELHNDPSPPVSSQLLCAGFELDVWRVNQFAFHLLEWLPDYALSEQELDIDHANSLRKLSEAAVRVYTSKSYQKRGEVGEIALHAICRDFFDTIPISPRVFYKSSSNDVVKAFDMVHARLPAGAPIEIWLGESKLYVNRGQAIAAAIRSIKDHISAGFLSNQKLLLGPQIPKSTQRYDEIERVFSAQESLDKLFERAVFVVGVLAESAAIKGATKSTPTYVAAAKSELSGLAEALRDSKLHKKLKLMIVYIPLASKEKLVKAFDAKLKGLQ